MAGPDARLSAFRADIERRGPALTDATWAEICRPLRPIDLPARTTIFGQARVGDRWLVVTRGVVASLQTWDSGKETIARFFESGQICGNLTSTWTGDIASDDLIAVSAVAGVLIPDAVLRAAYLGESPLSGYLRQAVLATLLFDKEVIVAKTAIDTETRYRFLETAYSSVLAEAPQRDIARFLGITPQGLSRFLKARRGGR